MLPPLSGTSVVNRSTIRHQADLRSHFIKTSIIFRGHAVYQLGMYGPLQKELSSFRHFATLATSISQKYLPAPWAVQTRTAQLSTCVVHSEFAGLS